MVCFLLAYVWFIFGISKWHTNDGKMLYIPTLAKQRKYTNNGTEGSNIGKKKKDNMPILVKRKPILIKKK